MLLTLHALNGLILFLPDGGDVQQHIGFPVALLRLVRFETVNRGSRDNFLARAIAFCLGDNPCFLGQMGGQRMIVVIGILQGVRQDKVGLDTAIHIRQTK